MQYDPIKHSLGKVFNRSPLLRKMFYKLLDLLLLRTWHIHKELKLWKKSKNTSTSSIDNIHVLDAGAGFGQYSYYLSNLSKYWDILGIDIKQEQVDDCNNFFKKIGRSSIVRFETADLTAFREKNAFDLILSVDVMEHIEEDVAVFKNFYASLKNGGMLLISTPSDRGGSDVHGDNDTSFVDEHVRDGYNIKEIEEKLTTAGFSMVETRYTYGFPGAIAWRLSMKYPIQMLGITKLFFILLPFYYIIVYPISFVLNYFDLIMKHNSGTGLIVKAWK